jgi:alanine racemase
MTLVQSRHRPAARGITGLSVAVVDLSVPIGYADGVPQVAVRQASVLCRGVRMPAIGRIAMEWAEWAGTIPHDIYCGIGSCVPRLYEEGR